MVKQTVVTEKEEYHRVWNFVVPLSALGNDEPVKSIPPLTKTKKNSGSRRVQVKK